MNSYTVLGRPHLPAPSTAGRWDAFLAKIVKTKLPVRPPCVSFWEICPLNQNGDMATEIQKSKRAVGSLFSTRPLNSQSTPLQTTEQRICLLTSYPPKLLKICSSTFPQRLLLSATVPQGTRSGLGPAQGWWLW